LLLLVQTHPPKDYRRHLRTLSACSRSSMLEDGRTGKEPRQTWVPQRYYANSGQQFNDVERTAVSPAPPPSKPVAYGSIETIDSSPSDSLLEASPAEQSQPDYATPHQHRIILPVIKGHGRLVVAHRTVPYWIGMLFVMGAFAWAVLCAIYAYPVLGGHPNDWKFGSGGGR
jgi:hypothetical protein